MPRGKGEPISEPRMHLTLFGEWFYFLCDGYFHVSMYLIAQRMGVKSNVLSKNTRDPSVVKSASYPSRETVGKIVQVFVQLAKERNVPWLRHLEEALYHAAGYATEEESTYARESLIVVKAFADRSKKQNKERL